MLRETKNNGVVDYFRYSHPQGKVRYVILYYHGLGEAGDGIEAIETNEIPKLFKNGIDKECVLIAPYLQEGTSWSKTIINSIVDTTMFEYNVGNPNSLPGDIPLIVTGLSLGGIATIATLNFTYQRFNTKQWFDAAAVVCGKTSLTDMNPFLHIPIRWWHGTNDTTISINSARTFKNNLQAAGGDITLTELQGMGHNIWGTAYNEDNFWRWLDELYPPQKQVETECVVKEINGELFAYAEDRKYKLNATLQ